MLKAKTVETMSTIEKVCPLACFDIMTHLVVHLVKEFKLCGLVHTRWMFPMERYMKALKGYIRNMAQLEGNMVMGYSSEEKLGFYT